MINIAERPAEADDRAVPGHWEGDLIIGQAATSQRSARWWSARTGYAMLVCTSPTATSPSTSARAAPPRSRRCPTHCAARLTWDQGPEMRDWKQSASTPTSTIYFCDPHAPWQRGTNENTNGLLRQYFPKGTDFTTITELTSTAVADELNDRPRKRLGFYKPIEQIAELLLR